MGQGPEARKQPGYLGGVHQSKGVIPPNSYKGQGAAVPTLTLWNAAIVHKDTPEGLVYELTKALLENQQTLIQVHKSASETLAENIQHISLPLHRGAIRFYREKNIPLKESQIPPEAKR